MPMTMHTITWCILCARDLSPYDVPGHQAAEHLVVRIVWAEDEGTAVVLREGT